MIDSFMFELIISAECFPIVITSSIRLTIFPFLFIQATAEQIRLAQMISDHNDADFEEKVKQVSRDISSLAHRKILAGSVFTPIPVSNGPCNTEKGHIIFFFAEMA